MKVSSDVIEFICEEAIGMSNYVVALLAASIPAGVTMIGFVVTYFLNKRNFAEEAKKQKRDVQLEKMSELPYQIQALLDKLCKNPNDKKLSTEYQELLSTIFAYGSQEAIQLATKLQEIHYLSHSGEEQGGPKNIICYVLLLCQIKYDLTGIGVNPEFWYRMKITDYKNVKINYDKCNNELVKELKLKGFLRINHNQPNIQAE